MVRLMATVVEYTKTPDSKNYAGVIVGNLAGNLVDDIPFDYWGGATTITRIHTAEAGKVVGMRLLIALLKVPMQTMVHMPK